MSDQINLKKAGSVVVPVGKGANGGCPRILEMTVHGGG